MTELVELGLDKISDLSYNVDVLHTTIRVWKKTQQTLRRIHAETGESIVAILDRLASEEYNKILSEKEKKEKHV